MVSVPIWPMICDQTGSCLKQVVALSALTAASAAAAAGAVQQWVIMRCRAVQCFLPNGVLLIKPRYVNICCWAHLYTPVHGSVK
jgi:hypothetical protein